MFLHHQRHGEEHKTHANRGCGFPSSFTECHQQQKARGRKDLNCGRGKFCSHRLDHWSLTGSSSSSSFECLYNKPARISSCRETYVNHIVLGIMRIRAADVEPAALLHLLDHSDVVPAVEQLQ